MRQPCLGERAMKLEARNHPESEEVDAAGICSEGHASYPGRSADLPCATAIERWRDESAEVSRGRISRLLPKRRRAELVLSGQSRVLSARTGQKSRGDTGANDWTGWAGSPDDGRGASWPTGDTTHETQLAGAVGPVHKNRRIRNRTYGGNGMDAPARKRHRCARVEIVESHLNREERPR